MARKSDYDVQSLSRGLEIMAMLAEAEHPLGATELAQTLGVDKSTAFRLLSTLANHGYAVQDDDTHRYRAGLRLVQLSRRILDRTELRKVAKPWVRRLQQLTGESVHLAVLAGGCAVYIDKEDTGAGLNVNTEIGRQAPLHCSAIGKALVAELPEEQLRLALPEEAMTRYTPRTITSMRELLLHLESTRDRGYALDDEEFEPGVRCIAACIKGYRGHIEAAVGISGPGVRVTLERVPTLAAIVTETAGEVSRLFGYSAA
jgi:IclR family transcriptional regulator, KDG regulon repressor